jgi:hypothetical protein
LVPGGRPLGVRVASRDNQLDMQGVEEAELARMVGEINAIARRHQGLVLALRVGRRYARWVDAGLRVSLRRLGTHPDSLVLRTSLTTYVKVEQQARVLGPRFIDGLSLSMHVALLPVSDLNLKRTLADRALLEGWTNLELTKAVDEGSDRSVHRKRVLRLSAAASQTAASLTEEGVRVSLDGFDEAEGERLAAELETATKAIVGRLRGEAKAKKPEEDSGSSQPT